MESRNEFRQRGTGLREGWRKAPEPEPDRILREPRPGARRHALLMAGLGVVGAMAALLFAPQLRVPTQAESGNRSISRTLYPKAPGTPPMVAVPPDQPGTLPETPSAPAESAAPVVKDEATPSAAPDVVIREVPSRAASEPRATPRSRQVTAEPRTSPSRPRERKTASTRVRRQDRAVSRRENDQPTRMASVGRATYQQSETRSGRSYRSESSGEAKETSRRRKSVRRTASTRRRTESTRRVASSTRRAPKAITSTAGWKGSTDPKEQAFLKAWQEFKTKEEREEEERRRFSRRVSEELISDPRE